MITSRLKDNIVYPENREINKDDLNTETNLFIIEIKGVSIGCAIGSEDYSFISKGIIIIPLYLIFNERVIMRIGLFEILASKLDNILDDENNIDIEKLENPLIFSFVNKELLEKYQYEDSDNDEDEDDEESDIEIIEVEDSKEEKDEYEKEDSEEEKYEKDENEDSEEEDSEEDKEKQDELNILPEDNKELNERIIEDILTNNVYSDELKKNNWIANYFNDSNFNIVDNPGGGDCLFYVISNALKSKGYNYDVKDLREILSNEVTDDLFNNYKMLYDNYLNELNEINNKLENKVKIDEEYERLLEEQSMYEDMLEEYNFLENIETVDDFKNVIKSCEFWGETWAISTLERVLNFKLIILSSEAYQNKDYNNLIQCGQLNDEILQEKGIFKPKYYILTEWLGWHYKSVEYNNKSILTFEEIPISILKLILDKCLKRDAGPFYIIPKFKMLKTIVKDV